MGYALFGSRQSVFIIITVIVTSNGTVTIISSIVGYTKSSLLYIIIAISYVLLSLYRLRIRHHLFFMGYAFYHYTYGVLCIICWLG